MWWRFRRHKLAMAGLAMLGVLLLCALFPEFIAPYPGGQRDTKYVVGPPQGIHFIDAGGRFHLRPFAYGARGVRDPNTLQKTWTSDTAVIRPFVLFPKGE